MPKIAKGIANNILPMVVILFILFALKHYTGGMPLFSLIIAQIFSACKVIILMGL